MVCTISLLALFDGISSRLSVTASVYWYLFNGKLTPLSKPLGYQINNQIFEYCVVLMTSRLSEQLLMPLDLGKAESGSLTHIPPPGISKARILSLWWCKAPFLDVGIKSSIFGILKSSLLLMSCNLPNRWKIDMFTLVTQSYFVEYIFLIQGYIQAVRECR